MINKKISFIAAALLLTTILTGCKSNNQPIDEGSNIKQIASANFDEYMKKYGNVALKEVSNNQSLSEEETTLYKFLTALNDKDYAVAMRLSNYVRNPFASEQDFIAALSSHKDNKYNYDSIESRDLEKGVKLAVVNVDGFPDLKFTTVLIGDTYEYAGALVKINNTWKVAINGLVECTFEPSTGESLEINRQIIDDFYKVKTENGKDIYKVLLPSNTTYLVSHGCTDISFSGSISNDSDTINFQLAFSDSEINDFIAWEKIYYNNLYDAMYNGKDLSDYFYTDSLIQTAKSAIKEQVSKNISNVKITNIIPTRGAETPIRKVDDNTIIANTTITMSYTYLDNLGKLHTKDGVSETRVSAVFKRASSESNWQMAEILGEDPILTNSKFSAI